MKTPVGRGLAGLVLMSLLAGCQLIFGDYKMETSAGGKAAAPAQTSSAAGATAQSGECVSNGVYRCSGAVLEVCENHQWTQQQTCPSVAQCDADHAGCLSCEPGTKRCSAFRLEQCTNSGDGWALLEQCAMESYCDASAGHCAKCGVDEAFCSGTRLNVCNASRTGWDVTDCGDPDLCNTTSRSCRHCVEGEYQCSQATLQRCDSSQSWVTVDECDSNELCQGSLVAKAEQTSTWSGKCSAALCATGQYRCNPTNLAELDTCPPSRDRWEVVKACYTAALCDATAGACKSGCQPGSYQCDGAQLKHCLADGTKYEVLQTCATAAQCSATKQSCLPCVAGEYQCNGAQLQRCGAAQSWATVAACDTETLCKLGLSKGACQTKGCDKYGAQRCVDTKLQTCPVDLVSWVDKETCDTAGLCDATKAHCIGPVCAAGEYRCTGPVRERCNDARSAWIAEPACAASQICDIAKGCLGQCPSPNMRCNGKVVEQCRVDETTQKPTWLTITSCATQSLCQLNATTGIASCNLPVCNDNQYNCVGQDLMVCNAGRSGWSLSKTCVAPNLICDKVNGQCDLCTANTYACNATSLVKCDAAGQTETTDTGCLSCATSADKLTGYCYRCDAGNIRCDGANQYRGCATDRLSWKTPAACPNTYDCQIVDQYSDYCVGCQTAGENQCVVSAAPGSVRTCPTDRRAWSATTTCTAPTNYGCTENGLHDFCSTACPPNSKKCQGSTVALACATDGSGWSSQSECTTDNRGLLSCDPATGTLSSSLTPISCSADPLSTTPYCLNGACAECNGNAPECTGGGTASRVCNSAGTWVTTSCGVDRTCNPETGLCVDCTSTASPLCVGGQLRTCDVTTSTWKFSNCPTARPICEGADCVACNASSTPSDCPADPTKYYVCSLGTWSEQSCPLATTCVAGKCVECTGSSSSWQCAGTAARRHCVGGLWVNEPCPAASPHCSPTTAVCLECLLDADCGANATCQAGACVPNPSGTGGATGAGGSTGVGVGGAEVSFARVPG